MMNIEFAILRCLDAVYPLGMPEATLVSEIGMALAQGPTHTEARQALANLEIKRQAVGVDSEDRGRLWRITDNGRARASA